MPKPSEIIGVVGLGYVGLPLAAAMGRSFTTVGFDIDPRRVSALREGRDDTGEVTDPDDLGRVRFTDQDADLGDCTFYIVAVPTPVDAQKRPDFRPLVAASRQLSKFLRPGDAVVYESTVYPGATCEVCIPALLEGASVRRGDIDVGYSPERINPGDTVHTFDRIVKVVGADSPDELKRIASVYEEVVPAGVHRAPSIRVAEASKIVENIQRDVNIALINELATIFDRLGIVTGDVLEAAATKWNWLPFHPGLVGGHCIGVDPYYMAAKAEEVGVAPQVIISGRRVNDAMGKFLASKAIQKICAQGHAPASCSVVVLGASFKPDVSDTRNSKSFDVVSELQSFGVAARLYDPHVNEVDLVGYAVATWDEVKRADVLILAVPHTELVRRLTADDVARLGCKVLVDPHGALHGTPLARSVDSYWRL